MTVLIQSKIEDEDSVKVDVKAGEVVAVVATNGTGNSRAIIQIETDTDGWSNTGLALSRTEPMKVISGPISFRISKPVSDTPYAVELFR